MTRNSVKEVSAPGRMFEQLDAAVTLLDLIRSGAAGTRPELARLSGLGRNVVAQRVLELVDSGLVVEGSLGPSTGGRAPRKLRLRADAGAVLVAELGATSIGVALCDLNGTLSCQREERADITIGPEVILRRVDELFRQVLDEQDGRVHPWGLGISLPGPVEFRSGRPIAPPIMPGWDGFDVRGYFHDRFSAPVWVDNDVNVMALGEYRGGLARGERDFIYLKIGTGIGAGLVSGGRLHRGAQGCAGDVGHIAIVSDTDVVCRCGKFGCLEALAGGAALARLGTAAAREGRSAHLAAVAEERPVEAADISRAATYGDPVAVELLTQSARRVGEALAGMVNFFNPSLIVIGGGVAAAGDLYLAAVRQAVFSRSLPLATRELKILRSPLADQAGLMGAAFMVIDELLSKEQLAAWIENGSPALGTGAGPGRVAELATH